MQWVDASRQLIITHATAHSLLSCGGMGERMGRQKERKSCELRQTISQVKRKNLKVVQTAKAEISHKQSLKLNIH